VTSTAETISMRKNVKSPCGARHRAQWVDPAGTDLAQPDEVSLATEAASGRKSLPDLVSSLTSGRLRFALGELAKAGTLA
jgi:hypothetical protein